MNLRKLTILVIGITFLGLVFTLIFTLRNTLLNQFFQVERQEASAGLRQADAALQSNMDSLAQTARDWARREDTYQFIQSSDPQYIQDNLTANTYTDLEVNLIAVVDRSGKLLYGQVYNAETRQFDPLPQELTRHFVPEDALLAVAESQQPLRGYLADGQDLLVLVAHPVEGPSAQGPARGVFLIGRFLDPNQLLKLSRVLNMTLNLNAFNDPELPLDFQAARQVLGGDKNEYIQALDGDTIAAYQGIRDLYGQPIFILKIELPRPVYRNALTVLNFLVTALVMTSLVFGTIIFIFVEKMVLSRLVRLGKEVNQIGLSGDLSRRVTVTQRDELSTLSDNINQMLATLQLAQSLIKESEIRFRTLVEAMSDLVFTYDRLAGQFTFFGPQSQGPEGPDNLVIQDLKKVSDPDSATSLHQQAIQRSLAGEQVSYEFSVPQDGKTVYYQTSLSPIRTGEGEINQVVGVGREITDLKELETALRQQVQALDALHAVSRVFLSRLDVTTTLENACRLAVERFELDAAWVGMISSDGLTFKWIASYGDSQGISPPLPLPWGDEEQAGGAPSAIALRITQSASPREPGSYGVPPLGPQDIYPSQASIPLTYAGTALGVISMYSHQPDFFTPERVQVLLSFSNLAGMAVQNSHLFEQVSAGHRRLQGLSRRLVEVQEEERRQIALELHDEIGQLLTGLKLLLTVSGNVSEESLGKRLSDARQVINDLILKVRQLSLDLRPAMLDDLGLLPALVWHFERYRSQTGINIDFEHSHIEGRRFKPGIETAAYRVIQEALTNIARHARVKEATVRLWTAENTLGIQVEDHGVGFDSEKVMSSGSSRGLVGIRERVTFLDGQMTIDSSPGIGTVLTIELPLDGDQERRVNVHLNPFSG